MSAFNDKTTGTFDPTFPENLPGPRFSNAIMIGGATTFERAMAILQLVDARQRDLGGFVVRRVLPAEGRPMVGPFIFFDHMGPTQFEPGH
jgi:hypothetical protein